MSKMSEMDVVIEDLRRSAAAISSVAEWLSEQFSSSGTTAPTDTLPAKAAPVEAVIPLEKVRAALADKSRSGLTDQVRSLLLKYGADKLSGIDPAKYPALLADAEGL